MGRPLIRLAWERVGVPDEIIDWLVELDRDNHTVIRSTWAVEVWEAQGYENFANDDDCKAYYFDPERNTGQGDISSPQTWIVFFDIILRALEQVDPDLFLLIDDKGGTRPAPDVSNADDLVSVAATHRRLQAKAQDCQGQTQGLLPGLDPNAPAKQGPSGGAGNLLPGMEAGISAN